jgi:hypothetical protein
MRADASIGLWSYIARAYRDAHASTNLPSILKYLSERLGEWSRRGLNPKKARKTLFFWPEMCLKVVVSGHLPHAGQRKPARSTQGMPQPSSRVLEATRPPCFRGEAREQRDRRPVWAARFLSSPRSENEFLNLAENWRPWRAYAAIYLWASDAGCGWAPAR